MSTLTCSVESCPCLCSSPRTRHIDCQSTDKLTTTTISTSSSKLMPLLPSKNSSLVWFESNQVGEEGRGFYGKIELENTNGLMSWMQLVHSHGLLRKPGGFKADFPAYLYCITILLLLFFCFRLHPVPGCSKLGQDNPGTVWNLNSEYKSRTCFVGMTGRLGIWIPV